MASFFYGVQGARKKPKRVATSRLRGKTMGKEPAPTGLQTLTKREMTANEIAAYNLSKELEAYESLITSKTARLDLKREMKEMDQLRYMNMKYLAAALVMMIASPASRPRPTGPEEKALALGGQPTPEMWGSEAWQTVLNRLVADTKEKSVIKHQLQIVTYMAKVVFFREQVIRNQLTDTYMDGVQLEEEAVPPPPQPNGNLESIDVET